MPFPILILLYTVLLVVCVNGVRVIADLPGFTYNGFSGMNLLLDGAASVGKDGILLLTNGTAGVQEQGRCFYPNPVLLWQSPDLSTNYPVAYSFTSTFVFEISCSKYNISCGDGMTFVISPTADYSVAASPAYMSLAKNRPDGPMKPNPFVAIEFDIVSNQEFHDENNNHVGIDVNYLTSRLSRLAGYRDDSAIDDPNFRVLKLAGGDPIQVWVSYDGGTSQLDVTLAPVRMFKPYVPLLSYQVSLLSLLPTDSSNKIHAYIGFTASTGDHGGTIHRVLGWSFKLGGEEEPLDYSLMQLRRVHHPGHNKFVTWFSLTASVLAVLLAVCLVLCRWWRKKMKLKAEEERQENWEAGLGPCRFTYKDLHRATNGFTRLLGKGGFGHVYGGVLAVSGMPIAVKMISSADSKQGMAQFMAEIMILGRLRHRNLVRLLGYCRHKHQLLLVYEHMSNGSLDKFLHGQTKNTLIWSQRLRIIKCVAAGLLYLHEDWEQVIVHRDVKASNVLLDVDMNGRLGDFGLARLHDHGADAHTTHVAGTRGYLAPELTRFGKATKATNVFTFGAFVLEVAYGRRPVGLNARGDLLVLIEWVGNDESLQ